MKLGIKKSVDSYSLLIKKAMQTAWSHKELWVFAFVASFANSGAIFSNVVVALSQLQPASSVNSEILRTNLENIPVLATWVYKILSLNINQFSLIIILVVLIMIGSFIVVLGSQQFLLFGIHRSARRKKHVSLSELSKEVKHLHVLRLFAVNALVYLSLTIILTGSAIPLSLLLAEGQVAHNFFVFTGFYLLLFPIAFALNVLGIFSIINIVRRDEGIVDAMHHSLKLLKKNWLVLFEMSLLVFAINVILIFGAVLLLIIFGVIYSILAFATLSSGTTLLLTIISGFSILLAITISVAYFGMIVTFNYSVWMLLSEKLDRSGIMPTIERLSQSIKKRRKK